MDATANDVPHPAYVVEGFPTMYWAPVGGKDKPSLFDGRTYDEIVEYIEKELKAEKDEL